MVVFNMSAYQRPAPYRQRFCMEYLKDLFSGRFYTLLYTADLLQLVKRHQLTPHAYADE